MLELAGCAVERSVRLPVERIFGAIYSSKRDRVAGTLDVRFLEPGREGLLAYLACLNLRLGFFL
jgi:hypothetical protein